MQIISQFHTKTPLLRLEPGEGEKQEFASIKLEERTARDLAHTPRHTEHPHPVLTARAAGLPEFGKSALCRG